MPDELKKKSTYIIPVFLPEAACPNKCIYCNQQTITSVKDVKSPSDIDNFISIRLSQIPADAQHVEIAFFGGNFTGFHVKRQKEYLEVVKRFFNDTRIRSIRISTRPDNISAENLKILQDYGVKTIELGAQSMCNDVLLKSDRGHTAEDTVIASQLILQFGFTLGLQMMIGLPGDTPEKSLVTAQQIIKLGAAETRIYPLLVFRETPLYQMFLKDEFQPLNIEQVIEIAAPVIRSFEESQVKVLRVGLHPSEDLLKGEMVAGPWHPSLRQMMYTRVWEDILKEISSGHHDYALRIFVSSEQFPNAVGFKRKNALLFPNIEFKVNHSLKNMEYETDYC